MQLSDACRGKQQLAEALTNPVLYESGADVLAALLGYMSYHDTNKIINRVLDHYNTHHERKVDFAFSSAVSKLTHGEHRSYGGMAKALRELTCCFALLADAADVLDKEANGVYDIKDAGRDS